MGELIYDSNWDTYFLAAGITPDKEPMSLRSVIKLLTGAVQGQAVNANTVSVASNAGTVPVTRVENVLTNSSAATITVTMATTGALDGQISHVRIYDFSAAAQTITWVNTENSTVTASTTTNGSTTLPITNWFQFNGSTSKWRCILKA